jgi:hypothetical protein
MAELAEAGIVHLRLVVPNETTSEVLRTLDESSAVFNVARLPGAAIKPKGDLVLCDVAREEVSVVVEQLRRLGLEQAGSISIEAVESTISSRAKRAAGAAAGVPADAVI